MWHWHKDKDQWNRIENSKIKPHIYGKAQIFSTNGAGKNWTSTCKRLKLDFYLTPYKKLTQNGPKILNIGLAKKNRSVSEYVVQ